MEAYIQGLKVTDEFLEALLTEVFVGWQGMEKYDYTSVYVYDWFSSATETELNCSEGVGVFVSAKQKHQENGSPITRLE